ncbi:MAG: NADH-quinone oxidoreductase subunit NuoF [Anaerolineales bacterium]|nr:MAG: NADH-quinone oxidoreductase subunit NuoF [Anaerolineales bacterium]
MIRSTVLVSGDPLSLSRKAEETKLAIEAELSFYGLEDEVQVGYTGQVSRTDLLPVVIVYPDAVVYGPVRPEDAAHIVEEHLYKGRVVNDMLAPEELTADVVETLGVESEPLFAQKRVVLKRAGSIDPYNLEDYIASDGYFALGKALAEMTPADVLGEVRASNLQGRGGAGFPTGLKWSFVAQRPEEIKYVVCNADESEPGTFKDRLILEGDPHAILEGMALTGYAVGAHEGWIYIRGEYAMSADILRHAIEQAEAENLLGENILGSSFSFHVHIHAGAGAYICGEETALLESLEGKRGIPRIRPPYPTVKGFRGLPTVVNNVETIANISPIILNGANWYRTIGTERNPGTKVYTVLGDVQNTGLIEAPMGTTLREIIDIYGGGMKNGKAFKCAQTGGSSGSIIPAEFLDVPMDFATMRDLGAGLGSGALLICDEDTDVVDLAYVLIRFFKTESCGKCTPCRVGNAQMLEALDRLRTGMAKRADLDRLGEIANYVQQASFCGLGQAAPVPIITGLKYFYEEFEARIRD